MSKKYIAHLTQSQYEALQRMAEQPTQEQQQPKRKHHKEPAKQQPQRGGLDGFTVFLLVIVGLLIGWGIVS